MIAPDHRANQLVDRRVPGGVLRFPQVLLDLGNFAAEIRQRGTIHLGESDWSGTSAARSPLEHEK